MRLTKLVLFFAAGMMIATFAALQGIAYSQATPGAPPDITAFVRQAVNSAPSGFSTMLGPVFDNPPSTESKFYVNQRVAIPDAFWACAFFDHKYAVRVRDLSCEFADANPSDTEAVAIMNSVTSALPASYHIERAKPGTTFSFFTQWNSSSAGLPKVMLYVFAKGSQKLSLTVEHKFPPHDGKLKPEIVHLDAGIPITLTVPNSIRVTKHEGGFETVVYQLNRTSDGTVLITILDGGGAYDLKKFKRFCLNGKRAWRGDGNLGHMTVLGWPGVNSVSFSYGNLPSHDVALAHRIIASVTAQEGPGCP